jgi:hypothetical protein
LKYPELHSDLLVPPPNAKLDITDTSVAWFEEDGIYCSMGLKNPKKQKLEEMKAFTENWMKQFDDKICLLSVVDGKNETDKETRDYIAKILPKIVKAMALVVNSVLGRMASNLFFRVNKQDYPVKVFTDVEEARTWLRQYL